MLTAYIDDHGTPVPVGPRDASSSRTSGYTLKVPAARVTVRATGYAAQDHWIATFLGGPDSAAEATYLTPGVGETRNVADVAVAVGQHVGGGVTVMENGSQAPSGGVTVTAYSSYGGYAISHTVTAADGSFDLDGLSAWSFGEVRLTFTGVGLQDATGGATLPLDGTPGSAGWTQMQVDPDYPRLYPTSSPTISGDATAGQTLTAIPATWNYDGQLTDPMNGCATTSRSARSAPATRYSLRMRAVCSRSRRRPRPLLGARRPRRRLSSGTARASSRLAPCGSPEPPWLAAS